MAYFEKCPVCLNDILGKEYMESVLEAWRVYDKDADASLPGRVVELYPESAQEMSDTLALRTGEKAIAAFGDKNTGAATKPFMDITNLEKNTT